MCDSGEFVRSLWAERKREGKGESGREEKREEGGEGGRGGEGNWYCGNEKH